MTRIGVTCYDMGKGFSQMRLSKEGHWTTEVIFAMFLGNSFPNLWILILQIRLNNLVSKVDATFDSPESNSVSQV